ncbi:MAG: polysaccharide deacetylase family protein [Ignavibacteria bacterium]|nr:polysaccharide deacetylase family protein [Ignavibacteria bacterium]MCU7502356.1 polysaccharide deacetylase family protein [Ignavibacteria bacterium]MCU7515079.1 polysaccharide deacetylase family protein [Ignavibacteria bacterium]
MKYRRIKILISILFRLFLLLKNALLFLSGRKPSGRCQVIYYHSVRDDEKEKFIRQIKLLKKTVQPIRADYMGKLQAGKNYVIITFDDGFNCLLRNALPELIRHGIPCALFFPVKFLGRKPNWRTNTSFQDGNEEVMRAREIKRLPGHLVQIGSHSYLHRMMTKMDSLEVKEEFLKSKEVLEAVTGKPVEMFSFPYGDLNCSMLKAAREAGYKRLFSIGYEVSSSELKGLLLGRVRTDPSDSLLEFKLKILGAYAWLNYLRILKEKLIRIKSRRRRRRVEQSPEEGTSVPEDSLSGIKE